MIEEGKEVSSLSERRTRARKESVVTRTLRERIADSLRESILAGDLKPGDRLQEVEIAESYETSRTPVREALRLLEAEGFLQIRPRRGAIVTPITEADVREFYELKSILEGYAARKAAIRITDEDIDKMEKLNNELRRCYQDADVSAMIPVHNEFHETFVQACGNERLSNLVRMLVAQFQRFRIALSHTDAVEDSLSLHEQIIDAFRARDGERAAELVSMNSIRGSAALLERVSAAS